jgi:hypothetical protein
VYFLHPASSDNFLQTRTRKKKFVSHSPVLLVFLPPSSVSGSNPMSGLLVSGLQAVVAPCPVSWTEPVVTIGLRLRVD